MKSIEELMASNNIDIKSLSADGGRGTVSVNGIKCSLVFSWGGGWDHVSIAPFNHKITPSWGDMCKLKDLFFDEDEAVIQIHPKKQDYVNRMKNCLHLWKPTQEELPLPPTLYV